MLPQINSVLQHSDPSTKTRLDRVLFIDPGIPDVALINVVDKSAMPYSVDRETLSSNIKNQDWHILTEDPYGYLVMPEESIGEKEKRIRDIRWKLIQPLIENSKIDLLFSTTRSKIQKDYLTKVKISKSSMYKYLRLYWQRGMSPNALLPDYFKCGGKGKLKKMGDKKMGRPPKQCENDHANIGVNATEERRKKLIPGINEYLGTGDSKTTVFSQAYNLSASKYLNTGVKIVGSQVIPILPPKDQILSQRQARYWHKKTTDIKTRLIALEGERKYSLLHRPIIGNSREMGKLGPGSLYQLDAAIINLILVSSVDRSRRIGQPIIYPIIDVFSNLIVGINVSLEGPSYLGALMALENAILDKVEFCRRYGIEISEEDWPVHFLPLAILVDRGELVSIKSNTIINSLQIEIQNTAPYRADWKGIVEGFHNILKHGLVSRLPGGKKKKRERGDPEPGLNACLTLDEFRQILIRYVLYRNNEHCLTTFKPTKAMIRDKVPLIPRDIWNWGVKNLRCNLREKSSKEVHIGLLPREMASITGRSILFRGLFFDCTTSNWEDKYSNARKNGRIRIDVAYDPRSVNRIYVPNGRGEPYEICDLCEKDKEFRNLDWDEVKDLRKAKKEMEESAKKSELQSFAELQARINPITSQAKKEARLANEGLSKSGKLKGIRSNRKDERQKERKQHNTVEGEGEDRKSLPQLSFVDETENIDDGYIPQPSYTDELLKDLLSREK